MLTSNKEIHTNPNNSSTARRHAQLIISLKQEHHKFATFTCFKNFDLPPWGHTKRLVPVKPHNDSDIHNDYGGATSSSHSDDAEDDGVGAVREKLLLDFRNESEQLLAAVVNGGKESPAKESVARPWNLRARRAVCKEPGEGRIVSPARNADVPRRNGEVGGEKLRRVKFAVALSKAEIEADFLAMTGIKPARRPKKRPRNVQKQIDVITPGSYLTEITADMYKVPESAR